MELLRRRSRQTWARVSLARRLQLLGVLGSLFVPVVVVGTARAAPQHRHGDGVTIQTLSTRADLVSGSQVLVQIRGDQARLAQLSLNGEAFTMDVVKCDLEPLRRGNYPGITNDEWASLQQTSPTGVCNYSQPGMYRTTSQSWLSFANGPDGIPLGEAPRSASRWDENAAVTGT